MKYETKMKFYKHIITEEYVVDEKTYRAEFTINALGYCTGMAGYNEYCLGIILFRAGSKLPIGSLSIIFPKLQRSDVTNEEQMVIPCFRHWSEHPMPQFTPFAEREIKRVVTEYIHQNKSLGLAGFLLHSVSVSVGNQDSDGKGRAFPRGPINQGFVQ